MAGTFTINRIDIKRILSLHGVSSVNTEALLSSFDKMHRHVNATVFVLSLQKLGLKQKEISNILRRLGIDDVSIANVFNKVDEERIQESFGRVVEINIE